MTSPLDLKVFSIYSFYFSVLAALEFGGILQLGGGGYVWLYYLYFGCLPILDEQVVGGGMRQGLGCGDYHISFSFL